MAEKSITAMEAGPHCTVKFGLQAWQAVRQDPLVHTAPPVQQR